MLCSHNVANLVRKCVLINGASVINDCKRTLVVHADAWNDTAIGRSIAVVVYQQDGYISELGFTEPEHLIPDVVEFPKPAKIYVNTIAFNRLARLANP